MTSRGPPPVVQPIIHDGVIYQQDWDHGSQLAGAYIAAIDQATGRRLWSLRVICTTIDPKGPPHPGTYLGSMRREGGQLIITGEYAGRYVVDIATRTVISSDPSGATVTNTSSISPRGRPPKASGP